MTPAGHPKFTKPASVAAQHKPPMCLSRRTEKGLTIELGPVMSVTSRRDVPGVSSDVRGRGGGRGPGRAGAARVGGRARDLGRLQGHRHVLRSPVRQRDQQRRLHAEHERHVHPQLGDRLHGRGAEPARDASRRHGAGKGDGGAAMFALTGDATGGINCSTTVPRLTVTARCRWHPARRR